MKREKEGYDISERADNYLNNPETRARKADEVQQKETEPTCRLSRVANFEELEE
jgi:hypothetical protein